MRRYVFLQLYICAVNSSLYSMLASVELTGLKLCFLEDTSDNLIQNVLKAKTFAAKLHSFTVGKFEASVRPGYVDSMCIQIVWSQQSFFLPHTCLNFFNISYTGYCPIDCGGCGIYS